MFYSEKHRNSFLCPSTILLPPLPDLWCIPNLKPGNQIYLKLISGKRKLLSPLTTHADYWPTLFVVRGPIEEPEQFACWFKFRLCRERQEIITSWKSSVIYRKWLEVSYPGPMVSCPQSPNHPHNLHFCQQWVWRGQSKPITLSRWWGCRRLEFSGTVGKTLRSESVRRRDATWMLPSQ